MTPIRADRPPALAEQIDTAHVIDDALHASRGILALAEIVVVFAERGIVGGQDHVTAAGKLQAIMQVRRATEAGRLTLADGRGLVQGEDRGARPGRPCGRKR